MAAYIARTYAFAGKPALAGAWSRRAERLIGSEGDTYAHGYLALVGSESAAATGQLEAALALAEKAVAIGSTNDDRDLAAFAQSNLGWLKLSQGDVTDGFALLEEASFAAVNGELTPFTSGITACRMIGACRDLTDYRRATEWIEATEKYCSRNNLDGFPGICRIHRAEVAAVSGEWERAEQELVRATSELSKFNVAPPRAEGLYAIGDVRRLMGDLDGAEVALREAHQHGKPPQPALALVRLAQGNTRAAVKAIDAAVGDETWDRLARTRLLPAQAEIAIAAGTWPRPAGRSTSWRQSSPGIRRRLSTPALGSPRVGSCWPRVIRRAPPASSVPRWPPGATSAHRTRSPGHACSSPARSARSITRKTRTSSSMPPSRSSAGSGRSSTPWPPNAS